jgi:hypothetical protein
MTYSDTHSLLYSSYTYPNHATLSNNLYTLITSYSQTYANHITLKQLYPNDNHISHTYPTLKHWQLFISYVITSHSQHIPLHFHSNCSPIKPSIPHTLEQFIHTPIPSLISIQCTLITSMISHSYIHFWCSHNTHPNHITFIKFIPHHDSSYT